MTEIFIVEENEYQYWHSQIEYQKYYDPKGYDAVEYINCNEACGLFSINVYTLPFYLMNTIHNLINQAIGIEPRLYTETELRQEILQDNKDDSELLSVALRHIPVSPNLTLIKRVWNGRYTRDLVLDNDKTVEELDIHEGEVLFLRRTNLSHIIARSQEEIRFSMHDMVMPSAMMMRNSEDFFSSLVTVGEDGKLQNREEDYRYFMDRKRRRIALLYTDEDIQVASYVRAHFDELDKVSGRHCDLFFIENPASVDPFRFWRSVLEQRLYVAWKLLGWADSVLYNKSQVYDIATQLGIRFDSIPCAAIMNENGRHVDEVIELGENLASTFRALFSRFQYVESEDIDLSLPSLPESDTSKSIFNTDKVPRHICFLSHSSSNKRLVRAVATTLHSYGIETWFDEWEILPGDRITKKIEEGLSKATAVIIFLSQKSINSPWVDEEIHNALHQSLSTGQYQVIPVLVDECDVPLSLANYKRIEVGNDSVRIANEIKRSVLRISDKPPIDKNST